MEKSIQTEVVRGHVNTIILSALYESDKYGYEIGKHIENKTQGSFKLKEPTLYSSLKRLEKQGLISSYYSDDDEPTGGGRRKYYRLTEKGLDVTSKNLIHWEYSRTLIDKLVSDREYDLTQDPPAFEPVPQAIRKTLPRVSVPGDSEDSAADEDNFQEEVKTEETTPDARETTLSKDETSEVNVSLQAESAIAAPPEEKPEPEPLLTQENTTETEAEPLIVVQSIPVAVEKAPIEPAPQTEPAAPVNERPAIPVVADLPDKKDSEYKNKLNKLYQSAKNSSYTTSLMETKAEKTTSDYSLLPHRDNQPAKIVFNDEDELKELTEGYTIRQFVPGKNTEFKQQILKNTLLRDTLCIFYLVALALDFILYFCVDHIISLGIAPYLYAGIALLIFPLYGLVVWIMDSNKRDKARLGAGGLLFNAAMIFAYTALCVIIINLITKTNFRNVSEVLYRVVFPCIIAILPFVGCTIYTVLFRTRRYHI